MAYMIRSTRRLGLLLLNASSLRGRLAGDGQR
ncbi:leu operon leader peptide [Superficieibacter sp.]